MSLKENAEAQTQRSDGEIIPPELAVKAMRDSGYKNTAYALAELIDNSVQAKSTAVDVICLQESTWVNERERRRISEIGVLDNGEGMNAEVLRLALQFGNGTHLADRKGIGRFGMGLPNSSISQCRRVEVWTWQNGPDNALYTYLDVNEIENRRLYAVPIPDQMPLPEIWKRRSNIFGTSGTLVLWSKFDEHRLTWRGARATLDNTEILVGRMYRKFIDEGRVAIRLLALEDENKTIDRPVRVNDPLYLMKKSSTPEPFDNEPMFQRWGDKDEIFPINYSGSKYNVCVRMSWAREETLPQDRRDRGSTKYGKHAAKNIGLSIVREGRELHLDPTWAIGYDPRERWWGIEVEFPSTLDELFGVANNKQSATTFSNMAQFDWEAEAESNESKLDFLERIQKEGDPRALLFPIVTHIQKQLGEMRNRIKKQTSGLRTKANRHDQPDVADLATTKFNGRAEQGYEIEEDREEFTEKHRARLERELQEDNHYSERVAKDIANAVLKRKLKVEFLTKTIDGYNFFAVEHKQGGLTAIVFNTDHPFYPQLIESLDPEIDDETDADLIDRINKASDTLKLLFAAWARYEREEIAKRKQWLMEARQEWGKMARYFLIEDDDE